MKIKKSIQKTELIDIDLETPAYFKNTDRYYSAILSEDVVIKVTTGSDGFSIIQKCQYANLYQAEEILQGNPITADEFNYVLKQALDLIAISAAPLSIAV